MNRALLYLLRQTTAGGFRNFLRGFAGAKGILKGVGLAFVLLVMLGPMLARIFDTVDPAQVAESVASIRTWGTPGLLLFLFLTGLGSRALHFKPAEVDFLFPAPISRRQLVAYNILARLRVTLFSALWCSLFLLRLGNHWFAAFTGVMLSMVLMQLTSQCLGLVLSALSETLGKKLRRFALLAVVGLVVGGLLLARGRLGGEVDFSDVARAVVQYPAVQVLCSLTLPFVQVFVAESVSDYVLWAAVALAILGIEVVLMMLFDVAYTERAVAMSRKMQRRIQQLRSGGAFAAQRKGRFVLPQFPRLHGAGPLAWRQSVELARNWRSIVLMSLSMFLPMIVIIVMQRDSHPPAGPTLEGFPESSAIFPLVLLTSMSFFFSQNLFLGFLRDLDRMAYLKSLPISPPSVATGQLLTSALLLTAWQTLVLVALALITGAIPLAFFLVLVVVFPPLNWLVAVVDNSLFLFFPYRLGPQDSGNMPFMGRMMMVVFVKMMVLVLLGLLAFLGGLAVWHLTDGSLLASGLSVAALLGAACVPATWIVARAFTGFDVTRDMPA